MMVTIYTVFDGPRLSALETMPAAEARAWVDDYAARHGLTVLSYEDDASHPGCADVALARDAELVQLAIDTLPREHVANDTAS